MTTPIGPSSGSQITPQFEAAKTTHPSAGSVRQVADTANRLVEAQNHLALVFRQVNEAHYLGHSGREEQLNGQLEDLFNLTQTLSQQLDSQLAGLKAGDKSQLQGNTQLSQVLSDCGYEI